MTDPLLIDVPELIETPRLTLRPHRAGDGAALHEALVESLAELRRFLWFLPWIAEEQTPSSAEIRCRKAAANFMARTDLPFLAFDRSSGRLVGSVGLHRPDWQVPQLEVGYWVRTSAAGLGYVGEAVRAVIDCAFAQLGAQRVELVTLEGNSASRRVAERCGFRLEAIRQNTQRGPDGRLLNSCLYARLPARAARAAAPRPAFIRSAGEITEHAHVYPQSSEAMGPLRRLGKEAGLQRIGVNLQRLPPGARSSWPHAEENEEEFVYVIDGEVDAWIDGDLHRMVPGDLAAFPVGTGIAHCFINNGDREALLLVGGESAKPGSRIHYPLNPSRRADLDPSNWWHDVPQRPLGPHDGLPDLARR